MSNFDEAMATARALPLDELLRQALATGQITQLSLNYAPDRTQANAKDRDSSYDVQSDADPIVALRRVLERKYAVFGPHTKPKADKRAEQIASMFE